MTVKLYLVRHGETGMNKANQLQGITDRPLTPKGVTQAQRLSALLAPVPFTAAYSSDRVRAVQTAQTILTRHPGIALHQLSGLREYYFGGLEGVAEGPLIRRGVATLGTRRMVRAFNAQRFAHLVRAFALADPTGQAESLPALQARVRKTFKQIAAAQPDDATVLVVAHGVLLSALVAMLAPHQLPLGLLKNTSVTRIDVVAGSWTVVGVNLTAQKRILQN